MYKCGKWDFFVILTSSSFVCYYFSSSFSSPFVRSFISISISVFVHTFLFSFIFCSFSFCFHSFIPFPLFLFLSFYCYNYDNILCFCFTSFYCPPLSPPLVPIVLLPRLYPSSHSPLSPSSLFPVFFFLVDRNRMHFLGIISGNDRSLCDKHDKLTINKKTKQ